MRQLAAWERMTPAELGRLHAQRLYDMLDYARKHVPLYRTDPWQRALGDRPHEVEAWPVLERDVLQRHAEELRALPGRGHVRHQTSGSTGQRATVTLTRDAETWTWAHRYRMLMWHGVPIGAPTLRLSHDRRLLRDWLLGHHHVPALETEKAFATAASVLRHVRPHMVAGPPSTLFQLARYLRERGITKPLVRIARAGGEQLFPFQRTEIEAVLATRIVNAYGTTETGAIAAECPAGALHVYAEHVHLETVRGSTPVGVGELGDIVVTPLANPAMPLVRYRVGDRGRLSADRCRCGMPHPVLFDLQARASDVVLAADGTCRDVSALVEPLDDFFADPVAVGARQVQFEQLDSVNWRVWVEAPRLLGSAASAARPCAAMEGRLADGLRRVLGSECRLEVRFVERLERKHGKFRYYRRSESALDRPKSV